MLSIRGQKNADSLDVPWGFALGTTYDPDTNPDGMISFATAENWLIQKDLEDFANKVHIPGRAFSYTFSTAGGPRLPSALATHINEFFSPHQPLSGDDVKITAGATSLHEILAFSLFDPGDGVLTSRPYYGRFELDFGNKAGVKVVGANTYAETCFQHRVVQAFEEALEKSNSGGAKIGALLIVNPHNPLGRCYPRETLIALMKFCQKHNIHFISDEVYGLSVFDSGDSNTVPFTSALSIDTSGIIDSNLVHVIYGMSKDFGAGGFKIGALITRNEQLKKAYKAVVRFHGPSGPAIAIMTALLEDRVFCRSLIQNSRARIAEAYRFVTGRLKEMGVGYLKGSNAGFFVWVDMSPCLPAESEQFSHQEREIKLAEKLVDGRVFLQPGEEHALVPGWFRMVYTMERSVVEEGLRRVETVIKNIKY